MADERVTETYGTQQPHTTVIERRSGGGGMAALFNQTYFASGEIASPAFLAVSPTLLAAEVTAASRRFLHPQRRECHGR
jgi:hypothetical protein